MGRDYHPLCLKCQNCRRQLTAGQHAEVYVRAFVWNKYRKIRPDRMNEWERAINILCMFQHDEKPYCSNCYLKMFCPRGTTFSKAHTQIYTVLPKMQHVNLFPLCVNPSQQVTGVGLAQHSAPSVTPVWAENEQIQECKRRTHKGWELENQLVNKWLAIYDD